MFLVSGNLIIFGKVERLLDKIRQAYKRLWSTVDEKEQRYQQRDRRLIEEQNERAFQQIQRQKNNPSEEINPKTNDPFKIEDFMIPTISINKIPEGFPLN